MRHAFCTYCSNCNKCEVVTMHHNKDTQEEIIVLEATVWAFWVLFFSLSYLLAQVIL